MEFKKFSVGNTIFPDEADINFDTSYENMEGDSPQRKPRKTYASFMQQDDMKGHLVEDFMTFLALCHKVVVEGKGDRLKY